MHQARGMFGSTLADSSSYHKPRHVYLKEQTSRISWLCVLILNVAIEVAPFQRKHNLPDLECARRCPFTHQAHPSYPCRESHFLALESASTMTSSLLYEETARTISSAMFLATGSLSLFLPASFNSAQAKVIFTSGAFLLSLFERELVSMWHMMRRTIVRQTSSTAKNNSKPGVEYTQEQYQARR
jgi:hypothetical protein